MTGQSYYLSVDDHDAFIVATDTGSLNALFLLIEQRTAIRREAAEALLEQGMMICGKELVVGNAEAFEA